ncbi:MAG: hypothetical protein GWN29_00215 [Gammaproteobacteria bacterium]|nr:hypothetical protein [Gammaproteobacteria bacterium]
MADLDTPIETLRGRLTQLLADWGAEMSVVLKDLEDLRERVDGQDNLIETLKGDAQDAGTLRKDMQAKELEVEKLRSELESKRDLVKVLRKDADGAADLRKALEKKDKALKSKDKEITKLSETNKDLETRLVETERRLSDAEESMAESHDNATELNAIRAELNAKTSLIKSLRTDAERFEAFENRLDEKRATIGELEKSLDSQADTIAELKDSVQRWKDRYAALKSAHDIADSMLTTMPDIVAKAAGGESADSDSDAETIVDEIAERTLAINMRDALEDAREATEKPKKKDKPEKEKKKATAS